MPPRSTVVDAQYLAPETIRTLKRFGYLYLSGSGRVRVVPFATGPDFLVQQQTEGRFTQQPHVFIVDVSNAAREYSKGRGRSLHYATAMVFRSSASHTDFLGTQGRISRGGRVWRAAFRLVPVT